MSHTATLLRERVHWYWRLARFHRPVGILLLLWPTLWALWIAGAGRPDAWVTTVFVLGVVLMRAAGCVINDYADRNFDPHVARTKERPIAAGKVTSREALALFAVLCLIALALVLTLNRLTVALSFVAAALAAGYPFTKRWLFWPQAVLGAAFGFAVPMAFAAQTGSIPPLAWVLYAAALVWALVYDTFYAMVDREDDLQIGVRSTAIRFGRYDLAIIGAFQALMVLLLVFAGCMARLGWPYYLALALGAGLFAHHQWLARNRDRTGCFAAFERNHWFGAVLYLGILLA